MSTEPSEVYYPGLEGVIAAESAICDLEGRGGQGGLAYRGYAIEDLAERVTFPEAAFLLLHGELPNRRQLADLEARLRANRAIPEALVALFRAIPPAVHPMDTLRTAVSVLAHFDADLAAVPTDHAANVRKAERLLAAVPTAIAYRERIARGLEIVPPRDDLDHAGNFLWMVHGREPSEPMRKAFDLSLVLYAEHELNASTFAGRVVVSTLSDLHSGIVAAIGALKGSLHGGANEEAWKLLEAVGSPERAESWVREALARKERIMGFGHRVYKTGDPRARILKSHCQALAAETGNTRWEAIAEPIERAVVAEKKLPPNTDWPSARLYHYMGLNVDLYTPIFAMARVSGWSAHLIEQLDRNRLMRPRARYTGPSLREIVDIARRG